MTDRYRDAIAELRRVPAPDQWDEIERRAAGPPADDRQVLGLAAERGRRRAGWPAVAVAVAAAVGALLVAATVALVEDDGTDVSTADPGDAPPAGPDEPMVDAPETTLPDGDGDGDGDPPSPATGGPGEDDAQQPPDSAPPATGGQAATGCAELPLTWEPPPAANDVLTDLARVPRDLDDVAIGTDEAGLPRNRRSDVIGVFDVPDVPGPAVFVIDGWGLGEDGGRRFEHPELGEIWIAAGGSAPGGSAPADTTALAELSVPWDETSCQITLWSVGLEEDQLTELILGLRQAP